MKFTVFDSDVDALAHWQRFATSNRLKFNGHTELQHFQSTLAEDTQIIVLDQSIAQGDVTKLIVPCCRQHRQHLFVATAHKLTVPQTVQMIRQCAAWVFEKPLRPEHIQPALVTLFETAKVVLAKLSEYRRLQEQFEKLTEREKAVLELILNGIANKDAAAQLKISIRTVEARRAKVYHKIETDNMAGLMRKVERLDRLRHRFAPLNEILST